jgi:hypothetical protein
LGVATGRVCHRPALLGFQLSYWAAVVSLGGLSFLGSQEAGSIFKVFTFIDGD